jgi:hypothetical protein
MKRRNMSKGTAMNAVSEESLMERLALGDQGALKQLMERWSKPVYSLALHILRDPGLAEAVTQDVFLRDCTWGAGFEESQGSFSTWLLSVTRKRALVLIRSRKAFGAEAAAGELGAGLGQALLTKGCLAMPLASIKALLQDALRQLGSVLADSKAAGSMAVAQAEGLAGGSWAQTSGSAV